MNEQLHEKKKPREKGKQHVTPRAKNNDLFVVAIDFGTSYTGYAYAERDSYETNPLRIYGMKIDNNQVFCNNHSTHSRENMFFKMKIQK